jgi:CheY-like chemotaxis protein
MQRVVKILLIEDDSLDQMEVRRTLEKKGILHKLTIANNGEDALKVVNGEASMMFPSKPDVILVDLNMPKMNGFEFIAHIKGKDIYKDIKIFVLSTSDENEDKVAAAKLGVSGFITKPLKLESPSTLDAFNLMIDLMNMQSK